MNLVRRQQYRAADTEPDAEQERRTQSLAKERCGKDRDYDTFQ